ncbi:uncharacterized protein [Lolium perenne]|uniref:uncharacterized protein isoform X2 n=1 Tax=Lolium perenne TaxID=4522 RepID=UPI003A98EBD9
MRLRLRLNRSRPTSAAPPAPASAPALTLSHSPNSTTTSSSQPAGVDEPGQGIGKRVFSGCNYGGRGGDRGTVQSCLFFLRRAAQRWGIWLFFLPRGMTRREKNRSRHFYRKDCMYWTLEWMPHSTDIVLTDHQNYMAYI